MVAMSPVSRPLSCLFVVAAVALLGGCATVSDSPVQQLEVRAILDYREIGGVGCILSNDTGRWYVIAPGRVTVTRSRQPLTIDCKKPGAAVAADVVRARPDMNNLVGNIVTTAGIGQLVDRESGAGYGYPSTLTVLMQPAAPPPEAAGAHPFAARMF